VSLVLNRGGSGLRVRESHLLAVLRCLLIPVLALFLPALSRYSSRSTRLRPGC
jgi:hypothetical protein